MFTLTSFFLSESGFASPHKALSGSWIAGIIVGAFSLLSPVISAYANTTNCTSSIPCGWQNMETCCCLEGDPELHCSIFGNSCDCS